MPTPQLPCLGQSPPVCTPSLSRFSSGRLRTSMCNQNVFLFLYFVCRSGTEEEYTELHQLLEDISIYMKDFSAIRAPQATVKEAQLKKAEENKRNGLEMRRAAME